MDRRVGLAAMALLTMAACATAKKEARLPVFYPPLPNPPRIQHLASFSSAADVGAKRSRFAEYIAGEDPKKSEVVQKPYGAGAFAGKLYLVDMRGASYVVFDLAKQEFTRVRGTGNGRMKYPANMAVDRDGTKYVTDVGLGQVLAFDKDDKFVRAYGVVGQFKPGDVAVAGDRLFVTDLKGHQIQVLDKRTGELLKKIGGPGAREGEFHYPTNLAVGPDDSLYVTDTMNFRVQKLTLEGKFVKSYGTVGDGLGQFSRPKGVAVDREGRMYISDAAFENVQIFDREGGLLLFFGGPGDGPENLNLPAAVVIDYESTPLFQKYADPRFKVEYVVLVASQFGNSKLNVFGFGKMEGVDYAAAEKQALDAKTKQAAPK
jgi:sugar lactone lactonase YvrE